MGFFVATAVRASNPRPYLGYTGEFAAYQKAFAILG
jgi:hypothetical protein